VKEQDEYTSKRSCYHSHFSVNKQNRDVKTHEQGMSAVEDSSLL
jgi:hypothetical protein